MKTQVYLSAGGRQYRVAACSVHLRLNDAGAALFEVESDTEINRGSPVNCQVLSDRGKFHSIFYGFVKKSSPISPGLLRLICPELSVLLSAPWPFSRRHVGIGEIYRTIGEAAGLKIFGLKNDAKIPNFISMGSFADALGQTLRLRRAELGVWYLTPKRSIYCGEWIDSAFGRMNPLDVAPFETSLNRVPFVHHLRPGVPVAGRGIVRESEFDGTLIALKDFI